MTLSLTLAADSASPLLSYSPASLWRPLSEDTPQAVAQYANGSTAATSWGIGAKMEFAFNGTGLWVFGAKRENHGFYNVTLDNETQTLEGYSSPATFQQMLYSVSNLPMGLHQLTITNAGPLGSNETSRTWFNIDWIEWETDLFGSSANSSTSLDLTTTLTENTYQISNSSIEYLPSSNDWQDVGYSGFNSGTSKMTNGNGASVNLVFDGVAVAVYGAVDPSHSTYTVSVDGGPEKVYSAYYNSTASHQQLLYYTDALGPGKHHLKVSHVPSSPSQTQFSLDFIRTWSIPGGNKSFIKSHIGVIAGGVCAIVVLLIITSALYIRRHRRKRERERNRDSTTSFGDISPTTSHAALRPQMKNLAPSRLPSFPAFPDHADVASGAAGSVYSFSTTHSNTPSSNYVVPFTPTQSSHGLRDVA